MFSLRYNVSKIAKLGMVINNYTTYSNCNKLFKVLHCKEKSVAQCFIKRCSTHTTGIDTEEKEMDFHSITNGDKEAEHKLKVILLEAEVMRQEGMAVPENSFLTIEHWKELLNLSSRNSRKKYLEYLFKISKKKENIKAKKLEKRERSAEFYNSKEPDINESIEEFSQKYDLGHNNIFLRFYDSTINQMYNNRLIQAMMFGQKLVIDCGYDENMTKRENSNCAKQLMLLFAENRMHDDPFDLHFCNANLDSFLIKQLHKHIPIMYEPSFPLNVHEVSYLDLFPKDQLIYLTPHCRDEMKEFDHNAIYIVGAIVDKVNNEPLSLAKAKKEGLKVMKLPLDKYLQWGAGSGKNLTLNQVTSILNDIKVSGNWDLALRHVPKRKIIDNYGHNSFDNQQFPRNKVGPKQLFKNNYKKNNFKINLRNKLT